MSNFVIGGWSQSLSDVPPPQFSYTMYGMVTNLTGLTTGTASAPGWSPAKSQAPDAAGTVMWTYGGGLCSPNSMPADADDIKAILNATDSKGWGGVDFDDECDMNTDNIILAMGNLAQSSYTFLAGSAYNNPNTSSSGQTTNEKVAAVAKSGRCDRFVLMCYATAMWSQSDIENNVGQAITRTLNYVGAANKKKVILALTPAGLNDWNLNYFLGQVISNDIGGLFIWNYPALEEDDLDRILQALSIS